MDLAAAGDAQLDFGQTAFEINRQRNQRRPALLCLGFQPVQLPLMNQQLSLPQRFMPQHRILIRINMAPMQNQLPPFDPRKRLRKLAQPQPQ